MGFKRIAFTLKEYQIAKQHPELYSLVKKMEKAMAVVDDSVKYFDVKDALIKATIPGLTVIFDSAITPAGIKKHENYIKTEGITVDSVVKAYKIAKKKGWSGTVYFNSLLYKVKQFIAEDSTAKTGPAVVSPKKTFEDWS